MSFQVNAGFDDRDAFAFEEFTLKGSVRFANEDFASRAHDAVPGDALSRGSGGHGAAGATRAATQTQGTSERPIG